MNWRHTDCFGEYVQLPLVYVWYEEGPWGKTAYYDAIVRNVSLWVLAAVQGGP